MKKGLLSVWFFIGCLLTLYGILILYAGARSFSAPPGQGEAMQQLHLPIWWGIFMTALGVFYLIHFRPRR
jgi:hypothetical protein